MISKLKDIEYFSEGKRSVVYIAKLNKKRVILKKEKKNIGAINIIKKESYWLKLLNKHKIGAKLIDEEDDFLIMDYIEGKLIFDYLKSSSNKKIKKVIKGILEQCRILDELKINKKEMNNPYKHIIIKDNKAYLIDFERCKKTTSPKNTTQFFDYLLSKKVNKILKNKGINLNRKKIVRVLKEYKKNYSKKNFDELLKFID